MRLGRRVAFDYGDIRIGVAICDPQGILATPLATLAANDKKLFDLIAKIFKEYEPITIYLGKPLHLSGKEGAASHKVENFGAQLESRFKIPIVYIDERLTSVSAARALREAGHNARGSKDLIDGAAAVAILEQGLNLEKNRDKQ